MKKNPSSIRLRQKRSFPMYGIAPNITQYNPVGDADLHIQGLGQPLIFKDIASVFPEKFIFDLTLSVTMVEHNTTVLVSPIEDGTDEEKDPNIIENVYAKQPAVQSISWSKPFNVHCIYQGAMRPNDPSWTITMPYDTYTFNTLGEGETNVMENHYGPYGGYWDTNTNMDKIRRVEARFSCHSEGIDLTEGDTFGQDIWRGGINMELLTARTSILTFGAYKMQTQQSHQINSLNDYATHYTEKYKSMYYEMLDQNTMRTHFSKNNTA